MSRVLVTGGAGFVGSHVAQALLARGEEVVVVDDLSAGRRENVPEGAVLLVDDLADPGVAARALSGCGAVVHCAALTSVQASVEDPVASNRANLQASTRLLVAAREAGVRRLVYSSTAAAYGDRVAGPADEERREEPVSPYGANKLAAELLFRMAPRLYGLDTVCLRYFNVYGPRQDPSSPYSGVISIFVRCAVEGRAPTIHGDGRQTRDFVYVGDVARANLAALDVPRGEGLVCNVATGRAIDLLELWGTVREVAGRPDLQPRMGPPRPGDIEDSAARVERARARLGFAATTPLRAGLERTVSWYRSSLHGAH